MSRWKPVRLGECCEIVSGATPRTGNAAFWNGDICWATPKDLSGLDGAYISDTPRKLTRAGLSSCSAVPLPIGSVLFSSRAPIGHVAINTVPMATNQGFKSFVPKSDNINAKFLFYWLRSNRTYLESLGNGATFKEVSKSIVSAIEIPLPPITEQNRIAAILDKADAICCKREKVIELADDFLKSVFLDMFGDPVTNPRRWPVYLLGELLEKIESGWSPKCHDRAANSDEWGVLKLGAVTPCKYIPTENKALPSELKPKKPLEVKEADLLFSRKNTYDLVAACAYVFQTREKLMISDLIFRFVIKDKSRVLPEYIWGLLTHAGKRKQVQMLAGGAAGSMPNISKTKLLNLGIELPPIDLQHKFANQMLKNFELKNKISRQFLTSNDLFSSLSQRAFRGDL